MPFDALLRFLNQSCWSQLLMHMCWGVPFIAGASGAVSAVLAAGVLLAPMRMVSLFCQASIHKFLALCWIVETVWKWLLVCC